MLPKQLLLGNRTIRFFTIALQIVIALAIIIAINIKRVIKKRRKELHKEVTNWYKSNKIKCKKNVS